MGGTRAFFAAVEARLVGGGEEEEDEEELDEAKALKEDKELDADFDVTIVIGRDSKRVLPSLMEAPSLVHFVSQSGDGLVQLLRGEALPGLLACAEKTRSY